MPAKLTPYGKEIRKLRVDAHATLKDMAPFLGVSMAYLSATETKGAGKVLSMDFLRSATQFFVDRTEHSKEYIENKLLKGLSKTSDGFRINTAPPT